MILTRRRVVQGGGLMLAGLPLAALAAGDAVEIVMFGDERGARVGFDPAGVLVRPGTTVTWRNADRGNAHTATAFHPGNAGHQRRIPVAARPWDSGYLLPDETFAVRLTVAGVYDYFCTPHEMAGMVGRIVVAQGNFAPPATAGMEEMFPPVEEIVRLGEVGAP